MREPARVIKLKNGHHGVILFDEFLVPLVVDGQMGYPSMDEVSAIGMAKKWNDAAAKFAASEIRTKQHIKEPA